MTMRAAVFAAALHFFVFPVDILAKRTPRRYAHIENRYREANIMRLILKILCAPIIVLLTLFVWICSAILYCSAFVFGIAGTIVAILGVAVLITYSVQNGIILLVIAFIISPMGLPMAAAWLIGKVQDLRYAIQDRVYG